MFNLELRVVGPSLVQACVIWVIGSVVDSIHSIVLCVIFWNFQFLFKLLKNPIFFWRWLINSICGCLYFHWVITQTWLTRTFGQNDKMTFIYQQDTGSKIYKRQWQHVMHYFSLWGRWHKDPFYIEHCTMVQIYLTDIKQILYLTIWKFWVSGYFLIK